MAGGVFAAVDEAFKDVVDLGGQTGRLELREVTAEAAPADEVGVVLTFCKTRRGGDAGFGSVMAAHEFAAGGGAAAFAATGEDEAAFTGH